MPQTVTIAVYLNSGANHFFGFDHTAKLAEAARFDLDTPDGPAGEGAVKAALETVFTQLNIDHPDQEWALRHRLAGHRSLSVGDVVAVGETAWACASMGWAAITAQALRAGLAA